MQDVFKVPSLKTGKLEPLISALTDEEEEQFRNMLKRIETIFSVRKRMYIRIYPDSKLAANQIILCSLTVNNDTVNSQLHKY